MKCLTIPAGVVCYADVLDAEVVDANGKRWRFDFCGHSGPFVVTRRGDVAARQPGARSPFWPAFEKWMRARRAGGETKP